MSHIFNLSFIDVASKQYFLLEELHLSDDWTLFVFSSFVPPIFISKKLILRV